MNCAHWFLNILRANRAAGVNPMTLKQMRVGCARPVCCDQNLGFSDRWLVTWPIAPRSADQAVELSNRVRSALVLLRVWSRGGSHYLVVENGKSSWPEMKKKTQGTSRPR